MHDTNTSIIGCVLRRLLSRNMYNIHTPDTSNLLIHYIWIALGLVIYNDNFRHPYRLNDGPEGKLQNTSCSYNEMYVACPFLSRNA
jgi:hypothetical protein